MGGGKSDTDRSYYLLAAIGSKLEPGHRIRSNCAFAPFFAPDPDPLRGNDGGGMLKIE
jgi:hypothetical protein